MMQDTFFSLPRFIDLCRKEMIEGWKSNLMRVVLMYGIMVIAFVWNGYLSYDSYSQHLWKVDPTWNSLRWFFIWGLFVFGSLSASFTMERMKTKTGRTAVLMTPATMFEKFFSRWLIFTISFLIVFLIAFKLADYTRVFYFSLRFPKIDLIHPMSLSYLFAEGSPFAIVPKCEYFWLRFCGFLFVQSCFILGSSIWPKNAFLKTFVALVLVFVVYGLVISGLVKLWFIDGYNYSNMTNFSEDAGLHLIISFCSIFALFNWVLAYFRFKESEIIHRM